MIKKLLTALITGAVVFLVVFFTANFTILISGLDRNLNDFLFYLRTPEPANLVLQEHNPYVSDRVRLVGIDDSSLGTLGSWPWDRSVHARYLERLQQFSPAQVHFDIAFVTPQSVPSMFYSTFANQPETLSRVIDTYKQMDYAFTDVLSKRRNVVIDIFLVGQARGPEEVPYFPRILHLENVIKNHSQLARTGIDQARFLSMEPLVESYTKYAQPVSVNVWPDSDDVLRTFMLCHTYRTSGTNSSGEKENRNLFSVVLASLMRYYHITNNDFVEIMPDKVILRYAKAPVLDPETKQPRVEEIVLDTLQSKIIKEKKPAHYNRNLYQMIVNEFISSGEDDEKIPYYPVHILKTKDKLEIIEGHEIFDAVLTLKSAKVRVVMRTEKDIVIRTLTEGAPVLHMFPINFAGPERQGYRDPFDGTIKEYRPIPTSSYKDVHDLPLMPPVPQLNANGLITGNYDKKTLYTWFRSILPVKYNEAVYAFQQSGLEQNQENIISFFAQSDPYNGRFYFYSMFFDQIAQAGISLPSNPLDLLDLYSQWVAMTGLGEMLIPDFHLSEQAIVSILGGEYEKYFSQFYGKFVFTGALSTGMAEDVKSTPYKTMFGINTIMNAFSTVVTDNQITYANKTVNNLILLFLCLAVSVLYGMLHIRINSYSFILISVGLFVASYLLFSYNNYFIKTMPLVFANLLIFGTIIIYKVLTEEKDKKFLKQTFSSYLAPELIDEMYESKTMPKLGGEAGIRTAFFTDIQGFSTFSEKLTAEQLVELLNEYLGSMTDIILAERGTLDKYIGDAIIAIFGAPMKLPDHSFCALKAAIKMQHNLAFLREKWRGEKQQPGEPERNSKNLPPEEWEPGAKWPRIVWDMRVRIGTNSGDMVTGNMGSTVRMNYTMMGDTVNLAARLEAGAKQFGVFTLSSESCLQSEFTDENGVLRKTGDLVESRFIDRITVVGKTEPVEVYEVHALKGELTESEQKLFSLFAEGVRFYQNTEWDKALEIFTQTKDIELYPTNKYTPSKMYIERCEEYKVNPPVPPGEKWDGVFRMTKKH